MKNAFSDEHLEKGKLICLLAFSVGRNVILGPVEWPRVRWQAGISRGTLQKLCALGHGLIFNCSFSGTQVNYTLERERGLISLCRRSESFIILQW